VAIIISSSSWWPLQKKPLNKHYNVTNDHLYTMSNSYHHISNKKKFKSRISWNEVR
jgi:hypothetical protein